MGFLKKPSMASIKLPSSKPSPAVEAVGHLLPPTPSSNSVRSSTNNDTDEERRDDGSRSSGLQVDAESCRMSVSSKKKDKISSDASVTPPRASVSSKRKDKHSSASSVTPSRASVSSKRKDKPSSASSVTPSRASVSSKKKDKSSSASSVTPLRASTSASKKKDKSSSQEAMKEIKKETPAKKESPAPASSPDNIEQQRQPPSPRAKSSSRHGRDKSRSKSQSLADRSPTKKTAPASSPLDKEKIRHERQSVSPRQSHSKGVRGIERGNSKHRVKGRSDKCHRSGTSRSSSKHRRSHHDRSSSRSRKQPVSSRDKERSTSSSRRRAPKNDAEDYAMEMEWKEASRKQHRERRRQKEKLRASIEESDDESSSGDDDDDGTFDDDESKRENDETTTMWNDASNLVINASHFFRNLTIAEDTSSSLVTDGASIDDDATLLTRDMSNIEGTDTQDVSEEADDDDDEVGKTEDGTPATNDESIELTVNDGAMTKSYRSTGSRGSGAQSAVTAKVFNTNKIGPGALLEDKFRMARSISTGSRKDRKEIIAEDDGVEVDDTAIGDKNGEPVALPAVKDAKSKDSILHSNEDKTDDDNTDDGATADETATQDTGSTMESNEVTSLDTSDTYIKKMEEFTVENHEHQLQVNVVEHGHIEKMLLQELPYIPKPYRSDEILVKIEASTVTLQDCMVRRGKWHEMQPLPFVPGSDFVGIILEMGDVAAAKSPHSLGDKVAAIVPSGGNAKYITLPYDKVIQVPQEIDSGLVLCLSSAYVPAREAMDLARKMNTPFTDANILVIGGNGPSGLAAIELALLEGANVFTTADERHHKFLNGMGAKCHPVDPEKWLPTLGGKMDVVLDSVCLDGYESSRAALNSTGMLVCTGLSAVYTQGQMRAYGLSDVRDLKAMHCKMQAKYMWKNAVYYDRMERYDLAPNEYAQHVSYLCHLAAKGFIAPLASARAPLNMVPSMQKAIEHADTTYGVCICTPWVTEIPYENGTFSAETQSVV